MKFQGWGKTLWEKMDYGLFLCYFTKNLATFFLCLENTCEVGLKGNGLVYLVEEIS